MGLLKRKRGLRCYGDRNKKIILRYVIIVIFLIIIIPLILSIFLTDSKEMEIEGDNIKVQLYIHEEDRVVEKGLEEYVVGVVAAEMPASFSIEALKAQAVAARTYVLKKIKEEDNKVKKYNSKADISSDPSVHQAWVSDEEMKKRWGSWNYQNNKDKIIKAVEETKGVVILYNNVLIDPLYHASCGGCGTENSEEVWKNEVPYLRRVECNHEEGRKEDSLIFSRDDFERCFGTSLNVVPTTSLLNSKKGIVINDKSPTGRVKSLYVGGKLFSGWEVRSKLSLPSDRFAISLKGDNIVLETRGYGHGVGMCQYGAESLAKEGETYEEILCHYYMGVTLGKVK